jgi:hypothetical protein
MTETGAPSGRSVSVQEQIGASPLNISLADMNLVSLPQKQTFLSAFLDISGASSNLLRRYWREQ